MASNFTKFTKFEFESGLSVAVRTVVDKLNRQGVAIIPQKPKGDASEFVYWVYTGVGSIYIKIFSSIPPQTGVSRDHGEDAVRFVLIDAHSKKALTQKMAHMQRITTWRKNLTQRIETLMKQAAGFPICEKCGAPKVERVNQNGSKFLGCVNYRVHSK